MIHLTTNKFSKEMNAVILIVVALANFALPTSDGRPQKRQTEDVPVVFPEIEEIPEHQCLTSEGHDGVCRPSALCVFRFDTIGKSELSSCNLNNEEIGICCPKKPPPSRGTGQIRPGPDTSVLMPDISLNELDSAGEEGLTIVQKIDQLEIELKRKNLFLNKNTKEYFHQALFKSERNNLQNLGRDGLIGVEATLRLVKTFQLDSVQSQDGLRRFSLTDTVIRHTCPKEAPCPPTKYRVYDGSCNNLDHSSWGKSFVAFSRLMPPRYYDGINVPRVSYDGGPLPSAREVSHRTSPNSNKPSQQFSLLFAQFAEFLAHDMSSTGLTTAQNGEGIQCCHAEMQRNEKLLHPACFPIYIPFNDPFYGKHKVNCMGFVRSMAAPRPDCNFGPREQLNQATSFIDGSALYGSSENQTKAIRKFVGGKLKFMEANEEEALPLDDRGEQACMAEDQTQKCHISGDGRVNEHPFLTAMHTLWLREHNRIAHKLSRLNPGWTDEILFKESRRILAAELQHITYSEFLPLLLGKKVMSSYKLSLVLSGHIYDYDNSLNPGVANSFAAAAFRMGHSLVPGNYIIDQGVSRSTRNVSLRSLFFNPKKLQLSFDETMLLLSSGSAEILDKYMTDELTNHLFETPNEAHGLDLIALIIQRGRDHGIAGYNEWRRYCGLPRIRNFEHLANVIDSESAGNFSRIYRNVDDIDLFPVAMAELPLPDGNLGPTFSCIIAEQFRRLKFGDRFWFENGRMESSFSDSQLAEIRKVTFARLVCDNTNIDSIQVASLLKPAQWNPHQSCKKGNIPKVDFSSWRNGPTWT